MPFCMAAFIKIIIISLSEIVTLQVRIPKENAATHLCSCQRRKAFLSASGHGAVQGSMTLEAAMVLSLLIFASVSLILPMKILNTERKIQAGLERVGEDFSCYVYIRDSVLKGNESVVEGAAAGYAQARVMEHADTGAVGQVTMARSEIMTDGEHVDLILDYNIRMPFPVLGLSELHRTARCRRRAWIGREGKDGQGSGDHGALSDEIVYVGKGGTRYHKSRNCHYLSNKLTAVSCEQVSDRRNESGGKYHACAVCGKQADSGGTVYILPEGSSYHTTRNCIAILAYVRVMRLSEVEYLGACTYCSQ